MPRLLFLTSLRLDTSIHLIYNRYLDSLALYQPCEKLSSILFLHIDESFTLQNQDIVYFLRDEKYKEKIRSLAEGLECREI